MKVALMIGTIIVLAIVGVAILRAPPQRQMGTAAVEAEVTSAVPTERTPDHKISSARPQPTPLTSHSITAAANVQGSASPDAARAPTAPHAPTTHGTTTAQRSPEELAAAISARFEELVADDGKHAFQNNVAVAHAAVRKEQVDPEWAPAANQQLESYFKSALGDRIDLPMVDCRTDICEIRAAGKSSETLNADTEDLQIAASQMRQQPWWYSIGFDEQSMVVSGVDGGPPVFILFLTRK